MNTKNQFDNKGFKVAALFIFTIIMSVSLALAQGDKLLLQFKGENGAGQG